MGSFKINASINNANKIDEEIPNKLNAGWSYSTLLQKANQYIRLDNVDIEQLKKL